MKKTVALVLALMMVLSCATILAEGFGEKDPESYNATLTFMVQSTAQPNYMIEEFNKVYPNICLLYTSISLMART